MFVGLRLVLEKKHLFPGPIPHIFTRSVFEVFLGIFADHKKDIFYKSNIGSGLGRFGDLSCSFAFSLH